MMVKNILQIQPVTRSEATVAPASAPLTTPPLRAEVVSAAPAYATERVTERVEGNKQQFLPNLRVTPKETITQVMPTVRQTEQTEPNMENKSQMASIRVSQETKDKLADLLSKVNDKEYGNKVTADSIMAIALSKVGKREISSLQEGSLSNTDRLKRDHAQYVSQHGKVSFDEYLGMRLSGSLQVNTQPENAPSAVIDMQQQGK